MSESSGGSTPPRTAVLLWPDGATSMGTLLGAHPRGTVFVAAEADGPLALRCLKPGRIERSEAQPGPIEVSVVLESDGELSTHVAARLLDAVPGIYPNMLEDLAETAGGDPGGLRPDDRATLSHVMQAVLNHIEDGATDPAAVRHARQALERPYVQVALVAESSGPEPRAYRFQTLAEEEPGGCDLGSMLQGLEEGAHLLVRVAQDHDGAAHSLAICATRLCEGQVHVNLVNPNGWGVVPGLKGFDEIPVIGKSLSLEAAAEALSDLNGGLVDFPAASRSSRGRTQWHNVGGGLPLAAWLRALDPETTLQLAPLRMTPQKRQDCAIEVEFAWLSSVLPEQDYKLAKAHGLNVLLKAAEANELDESVTRRLRERITSSLSGYSMAMGMGR